MQLRKYGTALSAGTIGSDLIRVSLRKAGLATYAAAADWTPAAGDVLVSKDGAAEANLATLPTYANGSWGFVLSAAELTAKMVRVRISDAALDDFDLTIETYGNAAAAWPDTYSNQLLPTSLVAGRVDASVGAMAANVLTDTALAPSAVTEIQAGLATPDDVADTVWAEPLPGAYLAGSAGAKLNAAGAASDPWGTTLPGAYGANTAGNIVGNRLNVAVGSRAVPGDAMNLAAGAVNGASVAANAIDADALATDAITEIDTALSAAHGSGAWGGAGGGLTTTDVENAVWNAAKSAHAVPNTFGDYLDIEVSSRASTAGGGGLDATQTAAAVWDALKANHTVPDSFGDYLDDEVSGVGAALLDLAAGVETGLTLRQAMRLLVAAEAGKLSGAETTTITIRNVADTKNRITASVDGEGNRSSVLYDLT